MKLQQIPTTAEGVMNRSMFVDAVARKARISRAMAERVVSAIFASGHGAIAEAVANTGDVEIDEFGTFEVKTRRHPRRNGKKNGTPGQPQITFRPSSYFALPHDCEEEDYEAIRAEEAAITQELLSGLDRVQGMEIENLFPSGWADDKIRT